MYLSIYIHLVYVCTMQYLGYTYSLKNVFWGAWLARSVVPVTLDLRVVSSSPTVGVEIT